MVDIITQPSNIYMMLLEEHSRTPHRVMYGDVTLRPRGSAVLLLPLLARQLARRSAKQLMPPRAGSATDVPCFCLAWQPIGLKWYRSQVFYQ